MDIALHIIKLVSMVLAGLFGLIGTFKDFARDADAAKWKKPTIAGIVITTMLSIVIQSLEFFDARKAAADARAAAETLERIQTRTEVITQASGAIQKDQSQLLAATRGVGERLEQSVKDQEQVLEKQVEAVKGLETLMHPVRVMAFAVTLQYEAASNACLKTFVDRLRAEVPRWPVDERGAVKGDPKTRVNRNDGMVTSVDFDHGATSLTPFLSGQDVEDIMAPAAEIAFLTRAARRTRDTIQIEGLTFRDALRYFIDFGDPTGGIDDWARSVFPAYLNIREVDVDFSDGEIEIVSGVLGVRSSSGNTINSVRDMIGTVMDVTLTRPYISSCVRPELDGIEMLWGPSYVYEADFGSAFVAAHDQNRRRWRRLIEPEDLQ